MVFKKKVYKQKIGTKTSAGDVTEMKRFTNGHKCFTTLEARAMNEQQKRERETQHLFANTYKEMYRPRDPMAGERTPRDGSRYKETYVAPYPLIPENRGSIRSPKEPKAVTLKVGKQEGDEYGVNRASSEMEGEMSHEETKRTLKINSLRRLQDTVSGELMFLQQKIADRKAKVNANLVSNFVTSQEPTRVRDSIF